MMFTWVALEIIKMVKTTNSVFLCRTQIYNLLNTQFYKIRYCICVCRCFSFLSGRQVDRWERDSTCWLDSQMPTAAKVRAGKSWDSVQVCDMRGRYWIFWVDIVATQFVHQQETRVRRHSQELNRHPMWDGGVFNQCLTCSAECLPFDVVLNVFIFRLVYMSF